MEWWKADIFKEQDYSIIMDINQIQSMRLKLHLTQKQLASLAQVSQSFIAKVEAGTIDPNYSKTVKVMSVLIKQNKELSLKAKDIMKKRIISVEPQKKISYAIELMKKNEISQLPVINNGLPVGIISESTLLHIIAKHKNPKNLLIQDVMEHSPPVVSGETPYQVLAQLLEEYPIILINCSGECKGVVTKRDIIEHVLT